MRLTALVFFVMTFVAACASYETFTNVQPSELNSSTLWPGMKLRLHYEDGTEAAITVREVTEISIISTDGTSWPKTGINSLAVRSSSATQDCGSLASWRNGQCWKDDIDREID